MVMVKWIKKYFTVLEAIFKVKTTGCDEIEKIRINMASGVNINRKQNDVECDSLQNKTGNMTNRTW